MMAGAVALAAVPRLWAVADTVEVQPGRFGFDAQLGLLVVAMTGPEANAQWPGEKVALDADGLFIFEEPVQDLATGTRYAATGPDGGEVAVYFTGLPLIHLFTDSEVVDEPKVPGWFDMWSHDQVISQYQVGMEYRGASSQALPKKSFLIEFRQDSDYQVTRDVSLLGMRSDDDWNLDAMSIEPLRLRSVIAQELWMDIHQPYYAFLEPNAQSGVHRAFAELFFNGSYRGLYAVGERVDRKQLQLKKFNGSQRGALFKGVAWGGSTFTSIPPPFVEGDQEWGGFQVEYPDEEPDWAALSDLVSFVVTSDHDAFLEGIGQRFLMANAVDYFLFLNLLQAEDNTGKNIFIARYKEGEPWFYVPWDLDGILGLGWNGALSEPSPWFLSNGLYDRWIDDLSWNGFRHAHCERWWELRQDRFTVGSIMQRFTARHAQLAQSGVYEREEMAWPDYVYDPGHLAYMEQWLGEKLALLDAGMEQTCAMLGMQEQAGRQRALVFPNPATGSTIVRFDGGTADMRIHVADLLGQQVMDVPCTGQETRLDLSHLAPGTYLVTVLRGGMRVASTALVVN